MALWTIGLGLEICWSAFYDDFLTVTSEPLRESTQSTVHRLFTLLGIDYATEGKKAPPFADSFAALGVQVDLRQAGQGSVVVGHTETSRAELSANISAVLSEGSMSAKDAERLRGAALFSSKALPSEGWRK